MRLFRISTLLSVGGAIAAGALLFWTSQNVQQAEDKLYTLNRGVAYEKQSIRVLNAEWAYLNRPDRIEYLAHEFLGMTSASPASYNVSDDISDLPTLMTPVLPARKPQPAVFKSSGSDVEFQSMLHEVSGEGAP